MTGILTTNDPRTISQEVDLIRADEARSTEFLIRVEADNQKRKQNARAARDGVSEGLMWVI